MDELKILRTINIQEFELDIYGSTHNPLFVAADVAKLIDYSDGKTGQLLTLVGPEEKLTATIYRSGQRREMWFLTESGFYEVLMQSRKPVARRFKTAVKDILHSLRIAGEGDFEDWLNYCDPLVEEWEGFNLHREKQGLESVDWESFLISKGYTDEMLEEDADNG